MKLSHTFPPYQAKSKRSPGWTDSAPEGVWKNRAVQMGPGLNPTKNDNPPRFGSEHNGHCPDD